MCAYPGMLNGKCVCASKLVLQHGLGCIRTHCSTHGCKQPGKGVISVLASCFPIFICLKWRTLG